MAHCASFLAILRPLHSITSEEQYKTLDINMGVKHALPDGSHITLSRIDIYRCQQKELEHKG